MSELVEATKKYWPWAVGGIVGLVVVNKMMGSSGGGSDYAASVAADSQAAQANAAIGIAQQNAQAANYVAQAQAQASMMEAQGRTAMYAASGAAEITKQLQAPTITAINATAAENIATLQSAATVAASNFQYMGLAALSGGMAASSYGQALGTQSESVSGSFGSANSISGSQQGLVSPTKDNSAQWQAVGTIASTALLLFSDSRLKKHIKDIDDKSSDDIANLRFVSYDYIHNEEHVDVGLIAQDVEALDKRYVVTDKKSGMLQLNICALLMASLQAIQTLQHRVDVLEREAMYGQ